jgi:hypothetical protein
MARPATFLRSCIRVLLAAGLIASLGFGLLAAALRQPVLFVGDSRTAPGASSVRLRSHVQFLSEDLRPRSVSHPENLERAANYIATSFRSAGARTALQQFDARGEKYANVIGEFGPLDPTAPVLILGAHYDAFSNADSLPGADDNASGVAGLLELARLLSTEQLERPVMLVAYANEEPPFFGSDLMGSAIHANQLAAEGRRVSGMICLEMIGYFTPRQAWPNQLFGLLYPSSGDFIGVTGGWSDRHLARVVKRSIAASGGVPVVSFSGLRQTSDASDLRNYWPHGWPAVMVTDTAFLRNPHYHTSRDTADTLDYSKMARVVDGLLNAAVTVSAN